MRATPSAPLRRLARALVVLAVAGCGGSDGGGGTTEPQTPVATTISIRPAEATLSFIGQTTTFTSLILDQNGATFQGTATWSSDDTDVFTVTTSGVVTAAGNGTATLRATFNNLTATATVTVSQVPASITVVSGNDQQAIAGTALTETVVVRVLDQGGAGVPGVTVTFTPSEGSVSPTTADTDEDGEASTSWTLGNTIGQQTLSASTDGTSTTLNALAQSLTPLPDLKTGGTIIVTRADPSSLETVSVQVTVRNDGNANAGAFRVQLTADGQEVATQNVSSLDQGTFETVTFTAGPFAAGTRVLAVNVDADGAVEEGNESNNTAERNLEVVSQSTVSAGTTAGLNIPVSEEMLFRFDLPVGSPSTLTVATEGSTGDADLFIEYGERPSNRTQYDDCVSGNPTSNEQCQIPSAQPGSYHILIHAWRDESTNPGPVNNLTMTITLGGDVLPYNIELVFIDNGTASQDQAVRDAAEKWMDIIPVDLPNSDFSTQPLGAGQCVAGQPLVDDIVDDVRIYVVIEDIDGESGTLAQAGPCVTRGITNLPIVGSMRFDEADLDNLEANGGLFDVVLHEMAHVLGLGTIWDDRGLLQNPSLPSNAGADTHFTGPLAIQAFDDAGGTSYTLGSKVPVENTAGEGSGDSHWRETIMTVELMTPFYQTGQSNPLSAITIQSMADLGYSVDVTQADAYQGNFPSPQRSPSQLTPVIDLHGDIREGPIYVVDQKGRIIRVVN